MKKILIICFMMGLQVFSAPNAKLEKLFMQGNSFYQEKQYYSAIEKYNEILKTGIKSVKVYYNLGCSYFRVNKIAQSRLFFEKALRLDSKNKKIINNLAIVKSKLKDKIENPKLGLVGKTVKSIENFLTYNTICILLLFFLIIFVAVVSMIISGRFETKPLYYAFVISLFLLFTVFSIYSSKKNQINMNEAIVFQNEVEIFSEPSTGSALLFKLHSGTKITIEGSQSGFYHISLPNGMNGWADIRSFNKI